MTYFYCILLFILLYNLFQFTFTNIHCEDDTDKYGVGKIVGSIDDNFCEFCKCKSLGKSECVNITKCTQLNCDKNNSHFEKSCCINLRCQLSDKIFISSGFPINNGLPGYFPDDTPFDDKDNHLFRHYPKTNHTLTITTNVRNTSRDISIQLIVSVIILVIVIIIIIKKSCYTTSTNTISYKRPYFSLVSYRRVS